MNQILYTGEKKQKLEINKIVIIFAIIIVIFAIALIGQGIYFITKRGNNIITTGIKTEKAENPPEVTTNIEDKGIAISIKHEIALKNVYYSWKNGTENEIKNVSGKTEIKETVIVPNEDTVLNIRIVDKNNDEYKVEREFKLADMPDTTKPNIALTSTVGYVIITVTDGKEISYMEYKWEGEEAVRIKANEDQKKKMEYKVPVSETTKVLTILAVDASGNTASQEKTIVPTAKPVIDLKKNKGEIIITVTDNEEVTKVVYEINGTSYTKENTGENKKVFEIRDLLVKGTNIIKVTAYNKGGLSSEKIGKCTY